jgi:integrase
MPVAGLGQGRAAVAWRPGDDDFARPPAAPVLTRPAEWTPRELRHSFKSLLSDKGTPLDEIVRLAGHSSTAVTELVCRQQIRPVLQSGAVVMDRIFGEQPDG